MKKLVFAFIGCFSVFFSFTQPQPNLDSILKRLPLEKNDSARFYLAFSALTMSETNPVDDMGNAQVILMYGQKNNDNICITQGLACLSYDYLAFGNHTKSLEYAFKTKEIADKTNDYRTRAPANYLLGENYFELGDYDKAKIYCLQALESSKKVEPNIFSIIINVGTGELYLAMNKIDSALIFTQKAYELSMSTGIKEYLCSIYMQLGNIQSKLNNTPLALSYLNLSLQQANQIKSPKYINLAHNAIANYYFKLNEKDSVIYHSKKAIEVVENTAFSTLSLQPSKMLLSMYKGNNVDSAFKYSEIYRVTNDSLYSFKKIQQTQLMSFEQDAKQKEIALAESNAEEKRHQNIEYVFIALGIIVFITLFLLFSRSIIANEKFISFFAILGLLVVFEFINLLLHPWLALVTHEKPVLMLLSLVIIAALLIPLHHWLEHSIKEKMIKKNNAIKLATAKRIIEKLEKKND